jgi:molybdate transport repressor ModE-like protein
VFKLAIKPQWHLARADQRQLLPIVVELLVGIHETGSLARACERLGLSYRYAWGLLQQGHRTFGVPLAESRRGRGAVLTPLGEKLVWADRRIAARLSPMLDSLASELEVELERALSDAQGILRIHASHGFAVELLKDWFASRQIPLDVKYRSSQESLAALASGACDVAGFHVPLGEFQAQALSVYSRWLRPNLQRLICLATRRQGLMAAPHNPRKVHELADLARGDIRFVNRQVGSGTRLLLDLLLKQRGIDPSSIAGYDVTEYTHAAVAAYVASGMADAGFGVETPAKRFGLSFSPLAMERYFLVCDEQLLASGTMTRVLESLRSVEFKTAVNQLPGYDGMNAGMVLTFAEAFEHFE